MSIVRKYIFVFAGLLMTAKAFGQAAPSPFSNFGIGESYGNGLIHNQGMGGTGVAQPQYWFLNNQNPALLVFNTLTIFEAGLTVEQRKIRSNELTEKVTGGNMNYLVTAFPVKVGKWTTSLGLMPLSSVNYKLAYEGEIEGSTNKVEVTEEGKGGLTQLYWSNGVRISPDFSVGLKASYVFSSILSTYKNRLINSTNPINYYSAVEQRSYVKDFMFTAGLSYSKDSIRNKDYRFSAGLVYTLGTDLRTTRTDKLYRTTQLGDTIESVILSRARGNIYLPANITVGFSYSKGARWVVATEFSYQDWSQFKSVNKDDEGLENGWRASLGGEITPDALGVDNYLKRITYRTGVSYEQYPFMANNKSVKDLGINFGLSLPTGRSSLDLAVKFGKRGNKAENILEENYFRLFFGITFNDQWFIKRKFD